MRIERSGSQEVTIYENIKALDDYLQIQAVLTQMVEGGIRQVVLKIPESISMPSSVIGFLLKLKNLDGIGLTLVVGDPRLHELLDELNLVEELNARLG